MIVFWIGTALFYLIVVVFIHKLFYKEVRGDEESNTRLWKFWGIKTAYWQGVLLIALGIVGVLLFLAKWANLIPEIE